MADSPRLALVVLDPDSQWTDGGLLERIGEWTKRRGNSPRLYPGSLVWCACKPGKELRRKAELLRSGQDLQIGIDFSVSVDANFAPSMVAELEQALAELEVSQVVSVRQQ